jgi:hypothetical protein
MAGKFNYNLEFDENTHWRLVRLGALKKMHQEDFLEDLITSVMEALAMDEKEREEGNTQANHIPDATKMVPVATDEELCETYSNFAEDHEGSLRAVYDLGVAHGQARIPEVAEPAPVAGGLVERVLRSMVNHASTPDQARAAILEVVRWLRELDLIGPANVLEWEAGR